MRLHRRSMLAGLLLASCVGVVSAQDPGMGGASSESETELATEHDRDLDVLSLNETRPCVFHVQIPSEYLEEHRTQQIADARLSLALDKEGSVLKLTYEDEETQAPVVGAFFNDKESESQISVDEYRDREDRSALIVFKVKAIPANFGAYTTLVEHSHVNESGEVLIKTMPFHNLETFNDYRMSIPGMLPGINRLTLKIRHTNKQGVTTTSDGISRFVVVDELPALKLESGARVVAKHLRFGERDMYQSRAHISHSFTLSPSVDASSITLRVLRSGERSCATEKLAPGVRGVVGEALVRRSNVLLGEMKGLEAAEHDGFYLESLGDRRYRLVIDHSLAASSSVLPLQDQWQYRIEVRHADYNRPIDQFSFSVGAEINDEEASVHYGFDGDEGEVVRVPFAEGS